MMICLLNKAKGACDGFRYRIMYLFPVICLLIMYRKQNFYGEFLMYLVVTISSAIAVMLTIEFLCLHKVKYGMQLACIFAVFTVFIVHMVTSYAILKACWFADGFGIHDLIAFTPWTRLIVTPIWMSLLSILVNQCFFAMFQEHPMLLWGGWVLSIISSYSIMTLMDITGLRNYSPSIQLGDWVEISILVIIAIGMFVLSSKMDKRKLKHNYAV